MTGGSVHVHRAAARLAARELRRRPWRTALVGLLVALPVAAMVMAASLLRTAQPPFDVKDRSSFGLADATVWLGQGSISPQGDPEAMRSRILAAAPGARAVLVEEVSGNVQGPAGTPRMVKIFGPEDDAMLTPRTTLRSGRLPRGAEEVALSPSLARTWRVAVGNRLEIPALALRATVVGIAHPLAGARSETMHVGVMPDIAREYRSQALFVDLPGDSKAEQAGLRAIGDGLGISVPERHRSAEGVFPGGPRPDSSVRWSTVVGALALAVFGIVIAAAFAVGARRQLRTLGILASNGASPAALRAVVLWQGAWAGLVGAGTGLVLGGVGLLGAWPHHDRFLSYEPGWFTVRPADMLPIVALGVLTAVLASAQPARSVSRLSILTALAGRRPLAPVRRRIVLLGLVAMAIGTAFLAVATVGAQGSANDPGEPSGDLWVGIAVLGGLGLLFGCAALAPAVVGSFEPLGRRLRGSPLLALRSLGRQRARTGAVVAAVCASAALAVAGSAATASLTDPSERFVPENLVILQQVAVQQALPAAGPVIVQGPPETAVPVDEANLAAVSAIIPTAKRVELPGHIGVLIATQEVLDTFGIDDGTRRLLRDHGAVRPGGGERFGPALANPPTPIDAPPPWQDARTSAVQTVVDAAVPGPRSRYGFVNGATLVSVEMAARHRLDRPAPMVALVSEKPLTSRQREAVLDFSSSRNDFGLRLASARTEAATTSQVHLEVLFDDRTEVSPLLIYAVLDGLALLFTGFVIVVGLAVAAAETREELEVLTAVGASPSTLRRLAGAKAALLAMAGIALAIPTGLVPVWVVRNASSGSSRFVVPWPSLALLVLVLPAAMAVIAAGGSSVLARFRPITASTMTAD